MTTILVVDDDENLREQLTRAFQRRGFDVRSAANYHEALLVTEQQACELAVIDLRMPGESGITLLNELKQRNPQMKVVMLTGFGSIANAVEAIRLGATNYLPKPAHADDILAAFDSPHVCLPENEDSDSTMSPSLAQAEWEHIQRVLKDCDGNISRTAWQLGISRRSLQRKLRKQAPE